LCFSQRDFQPFFANSFIMDVALQYYIYNRSNMGSILRDHQELGAHTDVIEIQPTNISTFRWTHHGARPMGFGFVKQCAKCHYLDTLKPTEVEDNSHVVISCRNCDLTTRYNFPRGWTWAQKPPAKGDDRGAWIVRTHLFNDDRDRMDTT
jgi:hypothetical protein